MLPKPNRIPSKNIADILRKGARIRGSCVDFVYKNTTLPPRFSVIVSTKIDKRAVVRNRMKRLVREAVWHILPSMKQGLDGVFIVRKKLPDNEIDVEKQMQKLLKWRNLFWDQFDFTSDISLRIRVGLPRLAGPFDFAQGGRFVDLCPRAVNIHIKRSNAMV